MFREFCFLSVFFEHIQSDWLNTCLKCNNYTAIHEYCHNFYSNMFHLLYLKSGSKSFSANTNIDYIILTYNIISRNFKIRIISKSKKSVAFY